MESRSVIRQVGLLHTHHCTGTSAANLACPLQSVPRERSLFVGNVYRLPVNGKLSEPIARKDVLEVVLKVAE